MIALDRQLAESNTVYYLREATGTRPDLRVVELDDQRLVVKDFRQSDFLFRVIVGPILIRREYGALCALRGLPNIPQIAGRIDRYALAMEYVPSTSLADIAPGTLEEGFYDNLMAAVEAMHSRGVAHCDLRSRGNVLLGDDGEPCLVDFAACVFRGRGINPFTRWLFSQFCAADRNAVLRTKQRLSPELVTDEERELLAKPMRFERPARFVGHGIRNLTRRLLVRRKS